MGDSNIFVLARWEGHPSKEVLPLHAERMLHNPQRLKPQRHQHSPYHHIPHSILKEQRKETVVIIPRGYLRPRDDSLSLVSRGHM